MNVAPAPVTAKFEPLIGVEPSWPDTSTTWHRPCGVPVQVTVGFDSEAPATFQNRNPEQSPPADRAVFGCSSVQPDTVGPAVVDPNATSWVSSANTNSNIRFPSVGDPTLGTHEELPESIVVKVCPTQVDITAQSG